jgi:hydroxymethylglutaryl-CoA lyase
MQELTLVECPRDAMQGIQEFIPTNLKAEYLNMLLGCGFDTLDFGSFVSPKAIPQLSDTAQVLSQLNLEKSETKLLAIIANLRGAESAVSFPEIFYLGFPFSISETFQQRNTNSSIEDSLNRVSEIQSLCIKHNKKLVIYISMAFGNPYGDPWNADLAGEWIQKLHEMGIREFSLADTTGISEPQGIRSMFSTLIPAFTDSRIGAHLHSTESHSAEKIQAALESGCRRFDSALFGYGGCPMATDKLTGNISTQILLNTLAQHQFSGKINLDLLSRAELIAHKVFRYH